MLIVLFGWLARQLEQRDGPAGHTTVYNLCDFRDQKRKFPIACWTKVGCPCFASLRGSRRSNHAQTRYEHSSASLGTYDPSIPGVRISVVGRDSLNKHHTPVQN